MIIINQNNNNKTTVRLFCLFGADKSVLILSVHNFYYYEKVVTAAFFRVFLDDLFSELQLKNEWTYLFSKRRNIRYWQTISCVGKLFNICEQESLKLENCC